MNFASYPDYETAQPLYQVHHGAELILRILLMFVFRTYSIS